METQACYDKAKADHNLGYNKALEDIKLLITNK